VFVNSKPFKAGPMFARKAKGGAPEKSSSRLGFDVTFKYLSFLNKLGSDKHASLLCSSVSDEEKQLYDVVTWWN
jgi:hypothetical protein